MKQLTLFAQSGAPVVALPPPDAPARNIITFQQPPTLQDLLDAYENFNGEHRPRKKMTITFKEEVEIPVGKRAYKAVKTINVHMFVSSQQNICYATRDGFSHGFYGKYLPLSKILSAEMASDDDGIKAVLGITTRIYPGTWEDFKKEIEDDPAQFLKYHGIPRYVSMSSIFSEQVCASIKAAFENKTRFAYNLPGKKRDRSVEMHACDDGQYRAWYSSEYSGCGNGDYYILINPTTAVFYEHD